MHSEKSLKWVNMSRFRRLIQSARVVSSAIGALAASCAPYQKDYAAQCFALFVVVLSMLVSLTKSVLLVLIWVRKLLFKTCVQRFGGVKRTALLFCLPILIKKTLFVLNAVFVMCKGGLDTVIWILRPVDLVF